VERLENRLISGYKDIDIPPYGHHPTTHPHHLNTLSSPTTPSKTASLLIYSIITMQFLIAASIFAAALAAPAPVPKDDAPASTENVYVTDFYLRKNIETGKISSVDFKLSGKNATNIACDFSNPTLPSDTVTCGAPDSNYRVILVKPTEANHDVDLSIYHQTGQASGLYTSGTFTSHYLT
jgi:hypothetical protein